MAGFGGVFTVTLMGLMLTIALSGVAGIMTSTAALITSQRPTASSISVVSGTTEGTNTFLINITLAGETHLRLSQIRLSDVFIEYVSDGVKRSFLVPYGGTTDGWHIQRVLVGNREGDLYNPMDLNAGTGIWDPGETIEINMTVSQLIDAASGWYFSITLVDGGRCECAF